MIVLRIKRSVAAFVFTCDRFSQFNWSGFARNLNLYTLLILEQ